MRTRTLRPELLGLGALFAALTLAVSAPSEAAQRQCQTLVTCNYAKTGSYRGCLSSYSCRQCRFVPSRCQVGNKVGKCQKLVCGWAGT